MLQLAEEEAGEIRRAAELDAQAVREQTAAEERALLERHAAGPGRGRADARRGAPERRADRPEGAASAPTSSSPRPRSGWPGSTPSRRPAGPRSRRTSTSPSAPRRAEAARAEEERERVSTQAARQRIAAAEQHAAQLVAEAEAKAEAIRDVRDELTSRLLQARQLLTTLPDLGDRAAAGAERGHAPARPATPARRRPSVVPSRPRRRPRPQRPRSPPPSRQPQSARSEGEAAAARQPTRSPEPATRQLPMPPRRHRRARSAPRPRRSTHRPARVVTEHRTPLPARPSQARGRSRRAADAGCSPSCSAVRSRCSSARWGSRPPRPTTPRGCCASRTSPPTPPPSTSPWRRCPTGEGAPLTDPGPDVATGVGYGALSAFTEVPAGSYAVSVRAAGAGRATAPVLTARIDVPAGEARTVALSGLFADLALETLADDLALPRTGRRGCACSPRPPGSGSVDVGLDGGPALATALPFGGTGTAAVVPAGPATLRVDGTPGEPTACRSPGRRGRSARSSSSTPPAAGSRSAWCSMPPGRRSSPPARSRRVAADRQGCPTALAWALGAVAALAAVSRRGRVLAVVAAAVVAAAPWAGHPDARPSAGARRDPGGGGLRRGRPRPCGLHVPSAGIDTALAGIGLDAGGRPRPPGRQRARRLVRRQGPAPGDVGPGRDRRARRLASPGRRSSSGCATRGR